MYACVKLTAQSNAGIGTEILLQIDLFSALYNVGTVIKVGQ